MREQDCSVIELIGALLATAGPAHGQFRLQDGTGAIQFSLSAGSDGVLIEGSSRFRGLAGQFSGEIEPTATPGVSRYVLEYSDPECCGSIMSFTADDGTGRILSVEPSERDRRDRIVLPMPADTEARQEADDAHYLEQNQVGP